MEVSREPQAKTSEMSMMSVYFGLDVTGCDWNVEQMIRSRYDDALSTFQDRLRESERFHMGAGNVHQTLTQIAKDLSSAGIDYAVLGAMPLNAYGYRRETIDLNLLVKQDGLTRFRETFEGRGYVPAFAGARKSFRNTETDTKVEFLTTGEFPGDGKLKPVAFPDPSDVAKEIDGVCFVDLPVLINLKLASGMTNPARLRDLADVQELARELGLSEDYATHLDPFVRMKFVELVGHLKLSDPHNESPTRH